jgi:signal transduction histidine kinase
LAGNGKKRFVNIFSKTSLKTCGDSFSSNSNGYNNSGISRTPPINNRFVDKEKSKQAYLKFEVIDTGEGIKSEELGKIFEAF